ncbi:DNA topoisomerase 1 [compost metagenome]
MTLKKKLFVVEASGKIAKVSSLLNELINDDFEVVATNGKLFNLPVKEIGVDLETLEVTKLVPISNDKIQFLNKKISGASHVYLMTDNDIEGEVIAKEISSLIPLSVPSTRLRFNALTTESLRGALDMPDSVKESSATCGLSRRIFDRIVGYGLSKPYSKSLSQDKDDLPGIVGRVLSPVLNELSSSRLEVASLQKGISDKEGGEWLVDISISNENLKLGRNAQALLMTLPDIEIIEVERIVEEDDSTPWSGRDTLVNVCKTLNITPSEAMREMQSLYESGDISYPRSDSRQMSLDSMRELMAVAENYGVIDFDLKTIQRKARDGGSTIIQGAHEAVIPLSNNLDINANMESLALRDQVLLIITKNAIAAGRQDLTRTLIKGIPSNDFSLNEPWNKLFSIFGRDNVSISKSFISTKGYKRKTPKNERFDYGTSRFFSMANSTVRYKEHQRETVVLMAMDRIGIGRPSTIDMHASKIASKYLGSDMKLNTKAELSLRRADILAPGLITKASCSDIDAILHTPDSSSTQEKIMQALKAGGIEIRGGKAGAVFIPNKQNDKDILPDIF